MNFQIGQIVFNKFFGQGVVQSVGSDNCTVIFSSAVGKKTILNSSLFPVEETKIETRKDIELIRLKSDVAKYLILQFKYLKITNSESRNLIPLVRKYFAYSDKDLLEKVISSLPPMISRKGMEVLIIKNKENINLLREKNKKKEVKIDVVNKFIEICTHEQFESTIILYICRFFLEFSRNIKDKFSHKSIKIKISDIAKYIVNALFFQVTYGDFYNICDKKRLAYKDTIHEIVSDNDVTIEERNKLIKIVSDDIKKNYINQFIIVDPFYKSNYLFEYKENANIFKININLFRQIKSNAGKLDLKIIRRLSYFLQANNSSLVNGIRLYISDISKGKDKKQQIVFKFPYEENLLLLSDDLVDDLYTIKEFKELMKIYSIPVNEINTTLCLARINFVKRSNTVILKNKYASIRDYYEKTILLDDYYEYSNKKNIPDCDRIIDDFNHELLLLNVKPGYYFTRHYLDKKGITRDVIDSFQNDVLLLSKKYNFLFVDLIKGNMSNNSIVRFCYDDYQLIQFVLSVPNIKMLKMNGDNKLFIVSESDDYRGNLIKVLMDDKKSMDIYDMHDLAQTLYNVDYSIDDIINDINYTKFYYNSEMEKVYRNKELFYGEIFENGTKNA